MRKKNYYPFNCQGVGKIKENKVVVKVHHHLCGYVEIKATELPKEWYGYYNADALQYLKIHGGITFCEMSPKEDYVIFGFDCNHVGDDENPNLQNVNYVMQLTEQMENQIKLYAKIINKWRKANTEKRCKMMDEICNKAKIKCEMGFGGMIELLFGAESMLKEGCKDEM